MSNNEKKRNKKHSLHRLPETPSDQLIADLQEAFKEAYREQYGNVCIYCCGDLDAPKDSRLRCVCGEPDAIDIMLGKKP